MLSADRRKARFFFNTTLFHVVMTIGILAVIFPVAWVFLSSLKDPARILTHPPTFLPREFHWNNYIEAWNTAPFARYFVNSIVVAIAVTAGTVLTSILAAYTFARINFPGREILFIIVLATSMIPPQSIAVPVFTTLSHWGLIDTYGALIIPFLAEGFTIFLLRQFFLQIPRDYDDAAQLDGCGRLRFLFQIMVPMSRPAIVAAALFIFMINWTNFFWPLILTNSTNMRTLPVGLAMFQEIWVAVSWAKLTAAVSFVSLPILAVYAFAQKYFVQGVTLGGLKG